MGKNFIIPDLNMCVPLKQEHFIHSELSKVHRIGLEIELMYFPSKIRNTGSGCYKMPPTNT